MNITYDIHHFKLPLVTHIQEYYQEKVHCTEQFLQFTPNNLNLQGKSKKVRVIRSSSYQGMGFLLTPLITCIPTGRTDTICVPKHQKTKDIDT